MKAIAVLLCLLLCLSAGVHAQDVDHPLVVGPGITPPLMVHEMTPEFTGVPKAELNQLRGVTVIAHFVVDTDGIPQRITFARSYGPHIDTRLTDAIRQYRFKPALKDGKAIAVTVSVVITDLFNML